MQFYIKLQFTMEKIQATPSLANKFLNIGKDSFIHRIFADFLFIKPNGDESYPLKGIIDTGSIISLLPLSILDYFPELKTEEHTLWGIVDSPECHLLTKIGVLEVKFIDKNKLRSSPLKITAAFSSNEKIPILIGMKDIFAVYPSILIPDKGLFEIEID